MTERHKRQKRARARHTKRYWREHDKDEYRCPDCGRDAEAAEALEVHHKDGNPENGDPENLVALCRRCHHTRHGQEYTPSNLNEWRRQFRNLGD